MHMILKTVVVLTAACSLNACTSLNSPIKPMAQSQVRIAPVTDAEASSEQKQQLDANEPALRRLNVVRTFARSPKLVEAWGPFAFYVLRSSSLPARDREILILRVGWLNRKRDAILSITHNFGSRRARLCASRRLGSKAMPMRWDDDEAYSAVSLSS